MILQHAPKNYSPEPTELLLIGKQKSGSRCFDTSSAVSKDRQIQVLLCGCGNAVHVLASYLGQHQSDDPSRALTFKVNILSLSHADRFTKSLSLDGYIRCINVGGKDTLGRADLVTDDPSLAVPGCSVILFALPADRHEVYLRAMVPYIKAGTTIGSMPGESGFDLCVRDVLGPVLTDTCTLFSLETLPWACRIKTFGRVVEVLGTKKVVDLCVHPSRQCRTVQKLVQSMLGTLPVVETTPTSNFLGSTIMNPNAIAHPAIMYGLLRHWDGKTPFDEPPLFYQALDKFTADVMANVSNEIMQIKKTILKFFPSVDLNVVRPIGEFFEEAYGEDIADHSSLERMFNTNKAYDGLTMPTQKTDSGRYLPLFDHRYLSEDLPCGLVVQKGIAELVGVSTPSMNRVIYWSQAHCIPPKEYLVKGKLTGKDVASTKAPQRYGFQDLATFMKVNKYV